MIITMLEATVSPENWGILQKSFNMGSDQLPPEILQSWLIQDANDKGDWRIVTLWKSVEALENYRQSTDTPGGILMFREAGAEPNLSKFLIRGHAIAVQH